LKTRADIAKLSDDELFELSKGEKQPIWFSELYRRYIPMVYGLCLKYLRNEADAQDAVMDLFEEVSGKIKQYDIQNFHTWLYSVVKNHCMARLRRTKRHIFVNIDEEFMENGHLFTLMDRERSDEEESALHFCMKELGEEQRRSLEFFYFENRSYADIVDLTGYPLNKVKSYIQNGKRNLKNCIERVLKSL
jgi:RNA polymerase sigma-70 factor (ECF subfamily)